MLLRKLRNKYEELGIAFEQIKERGTSPTCPVCGTKVDLTDLTFQCSSCGYR
ncbi:MAG: zinc ribbon domain-containing protein [Promethearchaeota archaeon]